MHEEAGCDVGTRACAGGGPGADGRAHRLWPEACDVTFEPQTPPPGLLRVDLRSTVDGSASAFVFGTAGIDWAELEAFAREPDFEHAPEVADVAGVFLEAPGSGTGWGEAGAGPLGVACAAGDVERPDILLRGPFELAP